MSHPRNLIPDMRVSGYPLKMKPWRDPLSLTNTFLANKWCFFFKDIFKESLYLTQMFNEKHINVVDDELYKHS